MGKGREADWGSGGLWVALELLKQPVHAAIQREADHVGTGEADFVGSGVDLLVELFRDLEGNPFGGTLLGLLCRAHIRNVVKMTTRARINVVKMTSFGYIKGMSEPDSTPVKKVSAPIRMEPALAAKVAEAVNQTGLSQAEIMRLALAIGLEDLRRVGYDLPSLVSTSARPDLEATVRRSNLTVVPSARVAETDEQLGGTLRGAGHGFFITRRGSVAAGGKSSAHLVEEEIPAGRKYSTGHYALRVIGQSMEPTIPDGSTIVVRAWTEGHPKKGTIVVYDDGYGTTLKVYDTQKVPDPEEPGKLGKVPILRSINPAFPDVETIEGGRITAEFVEVLQ